MQTKYDDVSISVFNEDDISKQLDQSIRELLVACFPKDIEHFRRLSWWLSIAVYRVLGKNEKGTIVSHTALVERIITIGPALKKMRIVGIQSFCVLPDYRGTGLSNKMMSVVLQEGGKRDFDAGLLFCREKLVKVYSNMGFRKLDTAVYMVDKTKGKTLIPAWNNTMFCPLRVKQFPVGDIYLNGADW